MLKILYNRAVSKIQLSVVIPCYDEMANLQKGVLSKVNNFLKKKKIMYEIIVVDDGSTDGSAEFVRDYRKEHPHVQLITAKHLGKAGAVTAGMLAAEGDYVLFTDMDQAAPIEEIDKLLPYFEKGFDIVIGSRGVTRKGAPWTRALMGRGMILLRGMLIGLKDIKDTQCGFKMFTRNAAKEIFSKLFDFHGGFHQISGSNVAAGFDVEVLYLAEKLHYRIKEIPVRWLYVETRRVNPIFDSIEGLRELFIIKKNALTGVYKKL
jgi:dolichyl-phosphate beta-glucosyltransferase